MARFNGNVQHLVCNNGNGFGLVGLLGNGTINTAMRTSASNLSQAPHLSRYPEPDAVPVVYEAQVGEYAARAGRPGCFTGALRCRGFARTANPAIQSRWPIPQGTFAAVVHQPAHLGTMHSTGAEMFAGHCRIPPASGRLLSTKRQGKQQIATTMGGK